MRDKVVSIKWNDYINISPAVSQHRCKGHITPNVASVRHNLYTPLPGIAASNKHSSLTWWSTLINGSLPHTNLFIRTAFKFQLGDGFFYRFPCPAQSGDTAADRDYRALNRKSFIISVAHLYGLLNATLTGGLEVPLLHTHFAKIN